MPSILYGTAWKKTDTARLVALAIAQGFRGIDTACQPKHYNEAGVGEGVQAALARGLLRSTVWRAFEALVDGGRVRQLGISNCYDLEDLEQLFASARIKPGILQNRFYAATGYDRELRAFCSLQQIVYQSFWTLSANPQILAARPVVSLATAHGRTAPQIFFRYLTQRGIVPLTGTKSLVHMREDLSIFNLELTGAELESIDRLLAVQ